MMKIKYEREREKKDHTHYMTSLVRGGNIEMLWLLP
jgi:hypothetical protein